MSTTILDTLHRVILFSLLILSIAACNSQGPSPQQNARTESPGFIAFGS
jgi:hypothetical protein